MQQALIRVATMSFRVEWVESDVVRKEMR
jgi:hypothetical protein